MGDIEKIGGGGLIGLIHGGGGSELPLPFERDIFLFETHVAGTTHIEGIHELEPQICIDGRLTFFRETNNATDEQAIVVKNSDGQKIGYVPQRDNAIFARLMDAGKLLFGKVSSKEFKGTWLKIGMKIYLHE